MPDLWDTNPHSVFSTPDERPTRPPEMTAPDSRLPAYVLIALGMAVVVAVAGAIVAVLVGFT